MAGTLIVSNLTTDTDNTFIVRSNTGTTLFSANTTGIDVANSIGATAITNDKILSVANTKISGNIISSQITSVANTQLTGLIQAAQIGSANATLITSGTLPKTRLPTGSVLQVVSNTKTDTFSSSSYNTWVDITGLSVTITPTSATSNVFVIASVQYGGTSRSTGLVLRCVRGITPIGNADSAGNRILGFIGTEEIGAEGIYLMYGASFINLDSPATTSSTTYKIQINLNDNYGAAVINRTGTDSDSIPFSRGSSSITVMEIAG